jgi:hypothetical protein
MNALMKTLGGTLTRDGGTIERTVSIDSSGPIAPVPGIRGRYRRCWIQGLNTGNRGWVR